MVVIRTSQLFREFRDQIYLEFLLVVGRVCGHPGKRARIYRHCDCVRLHNLNLYRMTVKLLNDSVKLLNDSG